MGPFTILRSQGVYYVSSGYLLQEIEFIDQKYSRSMYMVIALH